MTSDLWEGSVALSNQEMKHLLKSCKKLDYRDADTSESYVENLQSVALDFQMHGEVVNKAFRHSAKAKI